MAPGIEPLDVIAGQISAHLDKAAKADEHRLSAGMLLIEARRRVDAGEAGDVRWENWCAANIKRSSRDIRRVMRLAGASDPVQAIAQERGEARDRMQAVRGRTNVRPVSQPEPVHTGPALIDTALADGDDFPEGPPDIDWQKFFKWSPERDKDPKIAAVRKAIAKCSLEQRGYLRAHVYPAYGLEMLFSYLSPEAQEDFLEDRQAAAEEPRRQAQSGACRLETKIRPTLAVRT
jgi:hypothetical protein